MGELKRAIYARMEEVSFRSGTAAVGGVLTAAGVAITLAVVLGGSPGDAVTSAPAAHAPALSTGIPSVASPSPAPASSSPQAAPRPSRTTIPANVAGDDRPPPSAPRVSAARHAATTPVLGNTLTPHPFDQRWRPGHQHLREQPGWRGWHRQSDPWPPGYGPRHRRR